MRRPSSSRLVLPIFIFLLFGIIQYGFYFWTAETANSAAREAARRVVVGDCWDSTEDDELCPRHQAPQHDGRDRQASRPVDTWRWAAPSRSRVTAPTATSSTSSRCPSTVTREYVARMEVDTPVDRRQRHLHGVLTMCTPEARRARRLRLLIAHPGHPPDEHRRPGGRHRQRSRAEVRRAGPGRLRRPRRRRRSSGTPVSGTVPTAVLDAVRDSHERRTGRVNRNDGLRSRRSRRASPAAQLTDGDLANGEARFAERRSPGASRRKDRVDYGFAGIMGYTLQGRAGQRHRRALLPGSGRTAFDGTPSSRRRRAFNGYVIQQTIIDPALTGQDTTVPPTTHAGQRHAERHRSTRPAAEHRRRRVTRRRSPTRPRAATAPTVPSSRWRSPPRPSCATPAQLIRHRQAPGDMDGKTSTVTCRHRRHRCSSPCGKTAAVPRLRHRRAVRHARPSALRQPGHHRPATSEPSTLAIWFDRRTRPTGCSTPLSASSTTSAS